MIHPAFEGFDEGHNMERVAQALGFDSRFEVLHALDMTDEEQRTYDVDGGMLIESWTPKVPDGFELAGKWDHEDGPIAMFVKPTTPMAKAIWLIGLGVQVQAEPCRTFYSHGNGEFFYGKHETRDEAIAAGSRELAAGDGFETCDFCEVRASDLVTTGALIEAMLESAGEYLNEDEEISEPDEKDVDVLGDALGLLLDGWAQGAIGADELSKMADGGLILTHFVEGEA